MKRIFLALTSVVVFVVFHAPSIAFADCTEIYFKVGAGYKFHELREFEEIESGKSYRFKDLDPLSARLEFAVDCGSLIYGISHHSQWLTGIPFNNKGEPFKTEFFVDYKFSWGI